MKDTINNIQNMNKRREGYDIMTSLIFQITNRVPVLFPNVFNEEREVDMMVKENIITIKADIEDGWHSISKAVDIKYTEKPEAVTDGPKDVFCNSAILNNLYYFEDNITVIEGYAGTEETVQKISLSNVKIKRCFNNKEIKTMLKKNNNNLDHGILIFDSATEGSHLYDNKNRKDYGKIKKQIGVLFYVSRKTKEGKKILNNLDQSQEDFLMCCWGASSPTTNEINYVDLEKVIINDLYIFNYAFDFQINVNNFKNYNLFDYETNLKVEKKEDKLI